MKPIQVRRTRHERHRWRSKDELISDIFLCVTSHGWQKAGRPAKTYIKRSVPIKEGSLEYQPGAIDDRERWWLRFREIRASRTTWWWYMIYTLYIHIYVNIIYLCKYIEYSYINIKIHIYKQRNTIYIYIYIYREREKHDVYSRYSHTHTHIYIYIHIYMTRGFADQYPTGAVFHKIYPIIFCKSLGSIILVVDFSNSSLLTTRFWSFTKFQRILYVLVSRTDSSLSIYH